MKVPLESYRIGDTATTQGPDYGPEQTKGRITAIQTEGVWLNSEFYVHFKQLIPSQDTIDRFAATQVKHGLTRAQKDKLK